MRIIYRLIGLSLLVLMLFNITACSKKEKAKPKEDKKSKVEDAKKAAKEMDREAAIMKELSKYKADFNYKIDNETNNQWNINRGGLVARYDNWYYYADEKLGLLYKVKLDGSERKKVANNPSVNNINIKDEWVYYTSNEYKWTDKNVRVTFPSKVSGRIFKISIETDQTIPSNQHADVMMIDDTKIYFTNLKDDNKLYRMDLNFENPIKISDDRGIKYFYITGEYIYYLNEKGVHRIKNNGNNKTLEILSQGIEKLQVVGEKIYFMTKEGNYLYEVSMSNPTDRKLLLSGVGDFFINDNYVNYISNSTAQLMEANLNNIAATSVKKTINANKFSILGGVFFNSGKQEGKQMINGYFEKLRLNSSEKMKLSSDIREGIVGLDTEEVYDKIKLNVDKEDKNVTMGQFSRDIDNCFIGNSVSKFNKTLDIDGDRLNELFVIFQQNITEVSAAASVLDNVGGWQCGMYLFKWENKNFNIKGPYPLKTSKEIIRGDFLDADFSLEDIEKGGFKEILIYFERKTFASMDLFKNFQNNLEVAKPGDYEEQLEKLGFKKY